MATDQTRLVDSDDDPKEKMKEAAANESVAAGSLEEPIPLGQCIQKFVIYSLVGGTLRFLLLWSTLSEPLSRRVEISTPVSSWMRAREGVSLVERGVDPYSGDTFHESPLFLTLYRTIFGSFSKETLDFIFVGIDITTGMMLTLSSLLMLLDMDDWEKGRIGQLADNDGKKLKIEATSMSSFSLKVAAISLLSPLSIMATLSPAFINNFLTSLLLLSMSTGFSLLPLFILAILVSSTSMSIYALNLVPAVILLNHVRRGVNASYVKSSLEGLFFLICFSGFMVLNKSIATDWEFLNNTVWFQLTVPDLTPNIGIFWYFFTEMFDHFRPFFLSTFQMNAFIYTVPLTLSLKHNPYLLFFVQLILMSLFKPYPSVCDFAIYLSILPTFTHILKFTKQGIVVGSIFVTCSVLAPIMWHMWIMMGSANSNFYFGVTLAYNVGQILFVTDVLFANCKREFYLDNGISRDKNGNPLRLELVH